MSDPIVMVQAFAELRYGVVVHMRENSVNYGHNFNQTPYPSIERLPWFISQLTTFAKKNRRPDMSTLLTSLSF